MRSKLERQVDALMEEFLTEGQKCHLANKLWLAGYRPSKATEASQAASEEGCSVDNAAFMRKVFKHKPQLAGE